MSNLNIKTCKPSGDRKEKLGGKKKGKTIHLEIRLTPFLTITHEIGSAYTYHSALKKISKKK